LNEDRIPLKDSISEAELHDNNLPELAAQLQENPLPTTLGHSLPATNASKPGCPSEPSDAPALRSRADSRLSEHHQPPPTANNSHPESPPATNHQPPTPPTTNHHQPPTTNRHQPPTTTDDHAPTNNQATTTNHQSPPVTTTSPASASQQPIVWKVGSIATLHGCKANQDMNGARVKLLEHIPGKNRWKIQLCSDPSRRFEIKESNLQAPPAQQPPLAPDHQRAAELEAERGEEEEELNDLPQLASAKADVAVLQHCHQTPEMNGQQVRLVQYLPNSKRWEIQTLSSPVRHFKVKDKNLCTLDGRCIPPPHGVSSDHQARSDGLNSASSASSVRSSSGARQRFARASAARASSAGVSSVRRSGTAETHPAATHAIIKGSKTSNLNGTKVRLIRFHEDKKRWEIEPLDSSGAFLIKSSKLEGIDGPVSPA